MSAVSSLGKNKGLRDSIKKVLVSSSKKMGVKALDPRLVDLVVDSFVITLELVKDAGEGKLKNPKALLPYLAAKGIIFANLSGKKQAECAAAIAGFITTLIGSSVLIPLGPPGWTALVGLALIDIIDSIDKCHYIYEERMIADAVAKQQQISASLVRQCMPKLSEFEELEKLLNLDTL